MDDDLAMFMFLLEGGDDDIVELYARLLLDDDREIHRFENYFENDVSDHWYRPFSGRARRPFVSHNYACDKAKRHANRWV